MKQALTIITSASDLDLANTVGEALGMGMDNFTVPLSSDGENVTHYGLLHQASLPEFRQLLTDAQAGNLPPVDWSEYGTTEAEVLGLVDRLIIEVAETSYSRPRQHFDAVLAANGLGMSALYVTG